MISRLKVRLQKAAAETRPPAAFFRVQERGMNDGEEENEKREPESDLPKQSGSAGAGWWHSRVLRVRQADGPERPGGESEKPEPAPKRPGRVAGAHHPVAGMAGTDNGQQPKRLCGSRTRAAGSRAFVWSGIRPRGLPELLERSGGMGRPDRGQQAGRTLRD